MPSHESDFTVRTTERKAVMFSRGKHRDHVLSRRTGNSTRHTDAGFALVTVIWITGILATAAFVATSAATSRLRTVDALIANAEAEAAADAGVTLAIAAISERARTGPAASLFIPTIVCRLNDRTAIRIEVSDEAGKIDLNFASDDILRALMIGLGWTPDIVETRIDALRDYIDADNEPRSNGGEDARYREDRRANGPRNGPLASIFELGQIIGFETSSLSKLYPYVSVHSGQSGVDPLLASVEMRALLESGVRNEALDTSKRMPDAPQIPEAFRTSSTQYAMTVTSQAVSTAGAHFIREAVVSFANGRAAERASRYRIWRWSRGSDSGALQTVDAHGELKRC